MKRIPATVPTIATLLALALLSHHARAANIYWGGVDAAWNTSNWHTNSPTGPTSAAPGTADTVYINGGHATIGPSVLASSGLTYIGSGVGTSGTVTVERSWSNSGDFYVGGTGSGMLTIARTGTVNTTGGGFIGGAGGSGTVSVAGLWKMSKYMYVGHLNGSGNLIIETTGTVISAGARVAYGSSSVANSSADITVRGLWQDNGYMQIGQYGDGRLTIERSGTVNVTNYFIVGGGDGPGTATGYASVSGRLDVTNEFYVGNKSAGVLDITETGWVSNGGEVGIGNTNNGKCTGTANVWGFWDAKDTFLIGNTTTGVLNIERSGTVITGYRSYIGVDATGSGTVNVAGYWQTNDYLNIGQNGGSGSLIIESTGTVVSAGARITYTVPASTADIKVRGLWQCNGYMQVAQYGNASLDIEQSGTVNVTNYFIVGGGDGPGNTAIGYTSVAGQLSVTNAFYVGNKARGVLDIAETGRVDSGDVSLGDVATATCTGTANVAGFWESRGNFMVGNKARGVLDIATTGSITINGVYSQNAQSTLKVHLQSERTSPYILAGTGTLNGTLELDLSGLNSGSSDFSNLTKASQIPTDSTLIMRTSGTITGDFGAINVTGAPGGTSLPGFVTISGFVSTGTEYRIGYSLGGVFDLPAGKTFEVDVPMPNKPASNNWDGTSLIKTGPGTLIISASTTYTGPTIVNEGILQFGGTTNMTLRGPLINNSVVDLNGGATTSGHRTLTTRQLLGGGTFLMTVDPAAGMGDHLVITGNATGVHQLMLTGTGETPSGGGIVPLTLVSVTGTNNATFTGGLDMGAFNYTVQPLPDGRVVLASGGLSAATEAILGVSGAQNMMWFGQQDNLGRRFGDLRMQPARPHHAGLWTRGFAEHATIDAAATGRGFDMNLYGLTAGADIAWKTPRGILYTGAFANYGYATQDFDSLRDSGDADGTSTMLGGGLYIAWLHDTGWFVNATLGAARFENEFDASDQSDHMTAGKHDDTGFGISLEFGRRFQLRNGWFAELSAQVACTRLSQDNYTTTGANVMEVRASDADILRTRASALAGRQLTFANGALLQIHVRLGGVYETSSGGELAIYDIRKRPNLDGGSAEVSAGAVWQPAPRNQLYFDYEAAFGGHYEKPWGFSLGFRHQF